MDKKIDMAMPLNELPFIFDRELTTKILNENKIYTVEDLISCTESELVEMGINRLTIDYLKSTLAASYLYFRKENDLPQNLESANLTPELCPLCQSENPQTLSACLQRHKSIDSQD